ncbi:hypothetical protein [Blastococcus sp. Marseille-P5729]|uniref:hypothetical protein n=1 Tax=Blastococcus sp. Marseille-P5729 TaxID=2086582 RepID=UPI000D0F7424|nr:hypothetical protein [Blastococcus sp. Marseille-P5729]
MTATADVAEAAAPQKLHTMPTAPSWKHAVGAILAATTVVTLVLLAFAWPTYTSSVKDMPIAIAGAPQAVEAFEQQFTAGGEQAAEAIDPQQYADRAAAVEAIDKREVYGAIVLPSAPGEGIEVLTTSAGSAAASQLLTQVAANLTAAQQAQGVAEPVKVTDVVPLAASDARGAGLTLTGLPMAMGGMIGGVLISLLASGWRQRLSAVVGYAVLGGLALTGLLHSWFGWLGGDFTTVWAAISLTLAATASAIVGLQSMVGQAGIAIGAVLTMFIGNPLASLATPKEWLPGAWGEIGQYFVPGASGSLLRSVSYFPNASVTHEWVTLSCWFVVGVALLLIGHHRNDHGVLDE